MGQIKNIKLHIVTDIKKCRHLKTHHHEEKHQRLIITKEMPQGLLLSSQQCSQKVDVCSTFQRASIQVFRSFYAHQKGRRSPGDKGPFKSAQAGKVIAVYRKKW